MEMPGFEVGQKFLGLYTLKTDEPCAQCGDIVPTGTPVVESIGKYAERIICPRCFNWLRSNLLNMDLVERPEPVIEYYDLLPDNVPPEAIKECPECHGHYFHITWLDFVQDRFEIDPEDGNPEWKGLDWPDQDPGTIVAIQCEDCCHVLYNRRYA